MKQIYRKELQISSSCASSSDEEDHQVLCYSPEDEDQRQRFCDLLALAIPTITLSRDVLRTSVKRDDDDSDTESHPSLRSASEAELLDLCSFEDEENEQCDDDRRHRSTQSLESRDEFISRSKVRSCSEDHFFSDHNVAPELVFLVKRVLTNHATGANMEPNELITHEKFKREAKTRKTSKSGSPERTRKFKKVDYPELQPEESHESVETNSRVMEHLRELVYDKYKATRKVYSVSESIHSSVLSGTNDLMRYSGAFEDTKHLQEEYDNTQSRDICEDAQSNQRLNCRTSASVEVSTTLTPTEATAETTTNAVADNTATATTTATTAVTTLDSFDDNRSIENTHPVTHMDTNEHCISMENAAVPSYHVLGNIEEPAVIEIETAISIVRGSYANNLESSIEGQIETNHDSSPQNLISDGWSIH